MDVQTDRFGSCVGLIPMTPAGRDWIEANCFAEPWQWLGGALNIDGRYATDIIDGMMADGLAVA
jgi:hypothetical protein